MPSEALENLMLDAIEDELAKIGTAPTSNWFTAPAPTLKVGLPADPIKTPNQCRVYLQHVGSDFGQDNVPTRYHRLDCDFDIWCVSSHRSEGKVRALNLAGDVQRALRAAYPIFYELFAYGLEIGELSFPSDDMFTRAGNYVVMLRARISGHFSHEEDDGLNEAQVLALIASERRRRQGMVYNAPGQLFTGHTTQNSLVDSGESLTGGLPSGPRICLSAGVNAFGGINNVNECASVWEYFNNDPYADLTRAKTDIDGRHDAFFSSGIYMGCLVAYLVGFDSAGAIYQFDTGTMFGFGIGAPFVGNFGGPPVAESQSDVHASLRVDLKTQIWSMVVCNKFAAVGHRRFVKTLGTTAQLGLNPAVLDSGCGAHWEFEWLPNNGVNPSFRASIDGDVIGTFIDADATGGDTPCAGIWANKNSTGETIKGCGAFLVIGSGSTTLTSAATVALYNFYREHTAHW